MIINDREYAWGDATVILFARPVLGITGVSYKTKKSKTPLYAAGRSPKSIQHGKYEHDGSITLLQNEVIALNNSAVAAGYKHGLIDVDFDIIVKYGDATSGKITIDKITCASITEDVSELKEGDANMSITLPFVALNIKKNI